MFGELELDDDVAADNQMKYLNTMTIKLLAVFKNIESSFFYIIGCYSDALYAMISKIVIVLK